MIKFEIMNIDTQWINSEIDKNRLYIRLSIKINKLITMKVAIEEYSVEKRDFVCLI